MTENNKKEYIKGFFRMLVAIIGAIAMIVAAIIQNKNTELNTKIINLQGQVTDLKKDNKHLSEENGELNNRILNLENTKSENIGTNEKQKEIDDLTKQLSDLQEEKDNLSKKNEEFQTTIDDLNKLNNDLQENNNKLSQENEDLRQENDILRAESDDPSSAGSTTDANDTPKDNKENRLLSLCPPYESRNYSAPELIRIMGVDYQNGFWLSDDYDNAYAYFNLNQKYSQLKFKIGHVDGSSMKSRTLKIYIDEELQNIELSSDMVTMDYTISVKGKTQIRMIIDDSSGAPKYGIVEAYLY